MQSITQSFFSFIFLSTMFFGVAFASASATIIFEECNGNTCSKISDNTLSKKFAVGDTIPLRITIENPESAPVYSVQSWVKYNPTIFEVTNLSNNNSDFPLEAPGEFKAMNDTGEIRIGRAVAGNAVSKSKITVADFTLKVKKNPNNARIEFMDFIQSEIGKTAVVTIGNNIPANIINTKPEALRFETLSSAPSEYTNPDDSKEKQNGNEVYGIEREDDKEDDAKKEDEEEKEDDIFTNIERPEGFRSRTYSDGRVDHLWKLSDDSRIRGYYLYYSTTSGRYMHRRDMGQTNTYRFPPDFFEQGKRMYFAVQAYTSDGKLSDFSDETYVVVGTAGSESHPFFEQIFPDAESTGQDEKNKYYGADITSSAEAKRNTSSLPKPNQSPQSGFTLDLPFHVILMIGGLLFFFGGRLVFKEGLQKSLR